jgi:hypothetical protein
MDFPDNHSPTFLISYGEKTGQDRLGTRHKTIPYDLGILFSFIRGGQNGNLPIRMKNQQARFKLGNTGSHHNEVAAFFLKKIDKISNI